MSAAFGTSNLVSAGAVSFFGFFAVAGGSTGSFGRGVHRSGSATLASSVSNGK